jgi:hypothetical protein
MGVFPPRRVKGTEGIRKAAEGVADGAHARNAKGSRRVEASRYRLGARVVNAAVLNIVHISEPDNIRISRGCW